MALKKVYKPLGARVLVQDMIETLSLEERASRAGLHVIIEHENRPRPTTGRVIAVGDDPLMREAIKVGDVVFFGKHSGHEVTLEDVVFHQLDFSEITAVMTEEEYQEAEQSEHNPSTSPERPQSESPTSGRESA